MEEAFTRVVQHVFNNWTALRLAVEHSMGGPNSKETAIECLNYIVQYCLYQPNVQVEDIQEALEDILDEEFETICEDDSPKEIAHILFRFVQLLKEGNTQQCEIEYQNLPTTKGEWLSQSTLQPAPVNDDSSSSSDEEGTNSQTPMDEDNEWTQVTHKKRR